MSDSGLTLRHLQALDARVEQIGSDMARGFATVIGHLIALTGRVEGVEIQHDRIGSVVRRYHAAAGSGRARLAAGRPR
jgi:hypothetical protein